MDRLSGLQHHVIRHINNVVDRSEPGSFKPATHPIRTGTNGDASDFVKDRKWASLRSLNTNLRRIRNRFGRASAGKRCFWPRELEDDPQFARNVDVAQQIRTIGRDLEIENRVGREKLSQRDPDPRTRVKNHQSGGLVRKTELPGTAEHALGFNSPKLARFDFGAVRQNRSRKRQRHLIPGSEILRAANDLPGSCGTIQNPADAEAICIRMRLERFNLGNDDLFDTSAANFDTFNLDPSEYQGISDLLGRTIQSRQILSEPIQRKLHYENWARNR